MSRAPKPAASHSLFISNYNNPNGTDGEIAPIVIVSAIERHLGYSPFTQAPRPDNGGFYIAVSPQSMADVQALHGFYLVGRRRLWIVREPSAQYRQLWGALRLIFASISCGVAHLSDLRAQVQNAGGNPALVDFRSRDFVEFLLFALGRISQDDGFDVELLDVSNNPIGDLTNWVPFLCFLPGLHTICCENCALTRKPQLPAYIVVQGAEHGARGQKQKGHRGNADAHEEQ
jgi:hypothetical protein